MRLNKAETGNLLKLITMTIYDIGVMKTSRGIWEVRVYGKKHVWIAYITDATVVDEITSRDVTVRRLREIIAYVKRQKSCRRVRS